MGSWLPGFLPLIPDPGQSGPHSPSNAETPTAQGRRRCCSARRQRRPEGRAGLRGRRPAALARSPSPGGVPRRQLGSAPAPSREREQNALAASAPSLREHPTLGERSGPPPRPRLCKSTRRDMERGGSGSRDCSPKPGTIQPYLGAGPPVALRAESDRHPRCPRTSTPEPDELGAL